MTLRLAVSVIALFSASIALAHEPESSPTTEAPTRQALPPSVSVPMQAPGVTQAPASAATPVAPSPTASPVAPNQASPGLWCFSASRRPAEVTYERALLDSVSADSLRAFHDATAARPHRAGTEGDRAVINYLAQTFGSMGLDVETQEIDIYLAKPVSGEVQLSAMGPAISISEIENVTAHPFGQNRMLNVREPALPEDPFSSDPTLDIGFNAWSGNGDVTAEVVYANYGRKQDFERLKQLGVDVTGKIVIARYGGNYRGYKAKFAEEYGAAGLIIYTDPKDSGYAKGLMYPEGGWANADQIQRGSLLTLPYEGDPLSPGFASVPGAKLLDPKDVILPTIPVQPIGWGAAQPILAAMQGAAVPDDWQGGLPFNYRLTSGPDVKVRLAVEQKREVTRTANVVATLRGAKYPDEFIVIGCHHDAWNHGAADPLAGLITVLEVARVMSDQAKAGHPPDRSVVFAAWGAEEYGLMGSTEWVEANTDRLRENCVAYINLDMAAMGPNFSASSSPSIARAIIQASMDVPSCANPDAPVFDAWANKSTSLWPQVGTMGGGSDHVGFLCVAGVPCMGMGGGGSPGSSYHSNYDTLAWYRKVVGESYAPAVMISRIVALVTARMANGDIAPIDPANAGEETIAHLRTIETKAKDDGMDATLASIIDRAKGVQERGAVAHTALVRALDEDALDAADIAAIETALRSVDRAWIGTGLPGRAWFKF